MPPKAFADEGMWPLPMLRAEDEARMRRLGLAIPLTDIYGGEQALSRAILSFGSGGTASFISADGLILTNYHCSYAAVRQYSTLERNLAETGFWASARSEELPVRGLSVMLDRTILDVTDEVLGRMTRGTDLRSAIQAVTQKYQAADPTLRTSVRTYKNNTIFILYQQELFEDVRLVGFAPQQVAKFGGETDNWTWPRHNPDFAYYRVYASRDGRGVKYSAENVPYKPDVWLRLSTEGYAEGDFAMSLGYPVHNNRSATSQQIWNMRNVQNIPMIDARGLRLAIMREAMERDPELRLKYSERYSTAANYLKNAVGMNEWIDRLDLITKKEAFEEEFVAWIIADNERAAKYGGAIEYLESDMRVDSLYGRAVGYFLEGFSESCEMLRFVSSFGAWMRENGGRAQPAGRGAPTREDFFTNVRNYYRGYDAALDERITKATFRLIREKLPQELLPSFYDDIDRQFAGDIDAYVEDLFARSIFSDPAKIMAWVEKPSGEYDRDPAVIVTNSISARRSQANRAQDSRRNVNRAHMAQYHAALVEFMGDGYYPDADATLRLSYGTVQSLGDKPYRTLLSELIAKECADNPDYFMNPELRRLWESRDFAPWATGDDIAACFITNGDVTGGNSGSPMLDAHGRVIGLVFDCNWESMTRDYNYDIDRHRVICADVRLILLLTERLGRADNIIKEIFGE